MGQTSFSGPVDVTLGFEIADSFYIKPNGSNLEIGAGTTAGTNVAITIDSSGNVTMNAALVPEDGLIKQENNTGSLELTGDDASGEGGNLIMYGAGHATRANDFILRSDTNAVIEWDDSNQFLYIGEAANKNTYFRAYAGMQLGTNAPSANQYAITNGVSDGSVVLSGDTGVSSGGNIILLGDSHASGAGDVQIRSGSTVYMLIDDSASTIQLHSSGNLTRVLGTLQVDEAVGFYGTTPVSQASAYTQTYSTADKTIANPTAAALTLADGAGTNDGTIGAITADASVIAAIQELADQIGKLVADTLDLRQGLTAVIDDLQAYGLFQ